MDLSTLAWLVGGWFVASVVVGLGMAGLTAINPLLDVAEAGRVGHRPSAVDRRRIAA